MSSPEIALVAGQPTPQCTPPRNNGLLTVGFWVWYVSVGRLTKHEAPPSCFRIARKAWIVPAEIFSGVAPFPNALVIDKKHRYMNVTNKDIHKWINTTRTYATCVFHYSNTICVCQSVCFHIVLACSCPISKEKTGAYGCCLFSIFGCWSVERRLLLEQVRQTPGSLVMRRSPKLFVHVVRSSEDDASNCQFARKSFLPSILLWKRLPNQSLPIPKK